MKQLLLVLFFNFYVQSYSQQLQTYSFEQVEQLVGENPRPILLYFYTDWCQYCKMLQQTTFKDKNVIEKLNNNYYVVFFNAETKEEVAHKGVTYKFVPTGIKSGYHELLHHYIKNRQEMYPTILFLDEHFNELIFLQSYLSASNLMKIL
ncbi:thioredoxin family protein [Flavobacterium dauae]|uniref:thioredoxin family protein n=1 Tax=Flavobacterium dauae TaxID=1563479 RepID=UPI00101B317E|nr:thioredoxin family protein [Flavobacterium dauae]WLD23893.1 thioredoxin family protein [Flavobacterium dauae]